MTRIVAVDNDAETLDLFRDLLVGVGYDIIVCPSGTTTVACIRAARPDAIILDLYLEAPDDGLAVLRALHADDTLWGKPVIVCTAHVQGVLPHADELRQRDAAVLLKPFDIDELMTLLRQVAEAGRLTVAGKRYSAASL